jgi:hypothetical protein
MGCREEGRDGESFFEKMRGGNCGDRWISY